MLNHEQQNAPTQFDEIAEKSARRCPEEGEEDEMQVRL
jgi:hypothetical protein